VNELNAEVGLLKRQVRDVQSVTGNVQHLVRKLIDLRTPDDRPGGLCVRSAVASWFVHLGRHAEARTAFTGDRDLDRLSEFRSAVTPAMTSVPTWAAELATTVTGDLADRLIPESVFSQLRGLGTGYTIAGGALIRVPTWSPTTTGGFIAEGAPIPVSKFSFGSLTLGPKKAANIVALSDELAMGSPLDVEATLRTILSEALQLMIDGVLLGSTAVTTAAPAGLLNGVTPLTASAGGGSAALMGDIKQLANAIAPALKPVLIMNPTQAAALGLLAPVSSLALLVAPTLAAGTVIAIDAAAFASALGVPAFRVSQNAAVHEDTVPLPLATGAQGSAVVATPMRSTFQTDTTALRTIILCDWTLRRTGAVATITGATW